MFILRNFALCLVLMLSTANASNVIETLDSLVLSDKAPVVYDRQTLVDGMESLYFEGASYQGKPTRIFAYYNTPKGTGPFPAMVLVHGGGGSAFKEWVEKWNQAGFAAISIATEGQTGTLTGKKQPKWVKHQWGGPRRPGIYNDADRPLTDQWMNQVTTAAIQAHNLLRSFEEVNNEQIGISGISWGGVITSTVMGFDQRFAFAIPIYGSGFLDEMDSKYGKALKNNQSYKEVWEPALRIYKFTKPSLWMTGLKENNFSLDVQAKTYRLVSGQHYQSIQPDLKHSHKAGWAPKEPYLFAQAVINNQRWPTFSDYQLSNDNTSIRVSHASSATSSSFFYSNDSGHTHTRKWHEIPLKMQHSSGDILLTAALPATATSWVFNITNNELVSSSEFYERHVPSNQ